MEYTDAPSIESPIGLEGKKPCPFCGHLLPKEADKCDKCDWTREQTETAEGRASDAMAVILSIIPGLGHIYKGHRVMGMVIMLVITPLAIAFSVVAAVASAGWGILMMLPYMLAVMIHVWGIEDRVKPGQDEGEQY
jgi:hypothetical protein